MSFLGLGRRAIAHLSPLVGASPSRCLSRSAVASSGDALYVHRDSAENNSDIVFEFNAENKKRAEAIMSIYPDVSSHCNPFSENVMRTKNEVIVMLYYNLITDYETVLTKLVIEI